MPKFFKKKERKKGIIENTPLEKEYFESKKADPENGMANMLNKYLKRYKESHIEQEEERKNNNELDNGRQI